MELINRKKKRLSSNPLKDNENLLSSMPSTGTRNALQLLACDLGHDFLLLLSALTQATHGSSQRLRTEETAWEDEEYKKRRKSCSKERRVSSSEFHILKYVEDLSTFFGRAL